MTFFSHTTCGLSGLRWVFALGFFMSLKPDGIWNWSGCPRWHTHLTACWLMLTLPGELTQNTDQVVYTCCLPITWTSHSMTIIFQELIYQQSEPTARSCQTGPASLPYILLGSFPGLRIGGGDLAWIFLDSSYLELSELPGSWCLYPSPG